MSRILLPILGVIPALVAFGESAEAASANAAPGASILTEAKDEKPLVANGGFEELKDGEPVGWRLSGDIRVLKGEGQNGSVGLVFESPTPLTNGNAGASQKITGIRRGDIVRLTALVKKDGFSFTDYGAHVTLGQRDADGKWLGAIYAKPEGQEPDGTWTLRSDSRLVAPTAVSFSLNVTVAKTSVGRIAFDNIAIERIGAKPVAFVTTDAYRDTAAAGRVRFLASLEVPESSRGRAVARFTWKDASGRTVTRDAAERTEDSAAVALDVAELAPGVQTVACTLTDGDRTLGAAETTFTRVAELPRRTVAIDPKGRCLVNGKPFFPLGIYAYPKPVNFKKLADSPFNTILHYKMLTRAEMDEIARYGLKTFVALGDKSVPEAELAARIDAIKDHPALLAWYIGDERQITEVARQTGLYKLARGRDPNHPVYGVQDRIYDLRPFIMTMDVMGLDPYPVAQRPIRVITDFMRDGRAMMLDARPHWSVPQMFNWGWHRPAQRAKEHFPTEAEERSIVWQHIAAGANGLVAYKLQYDTPEEWEWCKKVYREVADRAETLISGEPVPTLAASSRDVACRAWVKDGRLSLVVCNILDTPQSVTVRVGAPFDRTLSLDLAPIGVKWVADPAPSK